VGRLVHDVEKSLLIILAKGDSLGLVTGGETAALLSLWAVVGGDLISRSRGIVKSSVGSEIWSQCGEGEANQLCLTRLL
jgi:hypothetical protein